MDTRCDRSAVIRKIFMVARPPGSLPFSHTHHVVRDISKASPPLSLSFSVTLSQRNVRPDSSENLSIDWFVCKGGWKRGRSGVLAMVPFGKKGRCVRKLFEAQEDTFRFGSDVR